MFSFGVAEILSPELAELPFWHLRAAEIAEIAEITMIAFPKFG